MKTVIQKADMDTGLTAILLRAVCSDSLRIADEEALPEELADKSCICIEAGGSGQVELNNYDHHDPGHYYPPACRQAYQVKGYAAPNLERLVDYVSSVDEAKSFSFPPFPSLSSVFSGMLLCETDRLKQFYKGVEILEKVIEQNLDPFSAMPHLPEWIRYMSAKESNTEVVTEALKNAEVFLSEKGIKIGYLETTGIGGAGKLYSLGCRVAILYNPTFGNPPVRKFTIAGNDFEVGHLAAKLNEIEPGWGGRVEIIGSPRSGSGINSEIIKKIVGKNI